MHEVERTGKTLPAVSVRAVEALDAVQESIGEVAAAEDRIPHVPLIRLHADEARKLVSEFRRLLCIPCLSDRPEAAACQLSVCSYPVTEKIRRAVSSLKIRPCDDRPFHAIAADLGHHLIVRRSGDGRSVGFPPRTAVGIQTLRVDIELAGSLILPRDDRSTVLACDLRIVLVTFGRADGLTRPGPHELTQRADPL